MDGSNWNILQSAYSQGHSIETALCKILDDIIEAADVRHITAVVSLDISAAFDVVDHEILIQQLEEEFGITDTCRNWIMSYLTGRSAAVRVSSFVIIYCWLSSWRTPRIGPRTIFVHGVRCSDRKTDPQPWRHLSPVC